MDEEKDYRTRDERLTDRFAEIDSKIDEILNSLNAAHDCIRNNVEAAEYVHGGFAADIDAIKKELNDCVHIEQLNSAIKQHNEAQ